MLLKSANVKNIKLFLIEWIDSIGFTRNENIHIHLHVHKTNQTQPIRRFVIFEFYYFCMLSFYALVQYLKKNRKFQIK